MKRATKLAIAIGTALTLALGAAAVSGHPSEGYGQGYGIGPGMMGGNAQGWSGHMGGYGQGYGMGPGMMGGYGQGWGGHMGYYGKGDTDQGLAQLKAQLGITGQQDPAWQAFVRSAMQQNEDRQAWFTKMHTLNSPGSAPELLAQQADLMKQRQAGMDASVAALKNLYAVLTPEQKSVADRRFGGF